MMSKFWGIMVILALVASLAIGCDSSSTPDGTIGLDGSTPSEVAQLGDQPTDSEDFLPSASPASDEEAGQPVEPDQAVLPASTDGANTTQPSGQQASFSSNRGAPTQQPPQSQSDGVIASLPGVIEILVTDAPPEYEITGIDVIVTDIEVHKAQTEQEQEQEQVQEPDGESAQNQNANENGKDDEKSQGKGKGLTKKDTPDTPTPAETSLNEESDESDAVVQDGTEDQQDDSGWISLGIGGEFDLILLQNGVMEGLGTELVNPGKYTQIRMAIESVSVEYMTESGTESVPAKLPSGKLKFVRPFNIESGKKTTLRFDFIADKFVHATGSGEFIVKPVIKLDVLYSGDGDDDGVADDEDICPGFDDAVDTDADGVPDGCDNCMDTVNADQSDNDGDGIGDACDEDDDGDGTADDMDYCPTDPNKTEPGTCGCGVADTDTDNDGTPDCNDYCPTEPNKTEPSACGCGVEDTDTCSQE